VSDRNSLVAKLTLANKQLSAENARLLQDLKDHANDLARLVRERNRARDQRDELRRLLTMAWRQHPPQLN
jgi:hypothetical protein